eukprot:gnl/MRDRNA2_/MRDRNA2_60069_c0_seq1.p1 gnl/MRDRNA2_/MRDRNA2_60069_c0~~gnl/MRDRNA2_/MRDRNA2_60069_c0_seq1.p1  ORF type:complete len:153 (+),score=41.88 gnl/MRDRNA2_/MRDRNA2_60069_c0_seq1:109-567(+)
MPPVSQEKSIATSTQPQTGVLFNNAHGFLHNISAEVELLKRQIPQNDDAQKSEIDELRKELHIEQFERRDSLNKLRYEFEEFVHRKIDKALEEVEEMKRMEKRDDSSQQAKIDQLVGDLDRLKENLMGVQNAWGKLVTNCLMQDKVGPKQDA